MADDAAEPVAWAAVAALEGPAVAVASGVLAELAAVAVAAYLSVPH